VPGSGACRGTSAKFWPWSAERSHGRCSQDPRRGRVVWQWFIALCVILIAAVVAGLPVYVRPQVDSLRHADAILVLGGIAEDRYHYGMALGAQGWAPIVVLSVDQERTRFCARQHPNFDLRCIIADPATTRGEARELRRLATDYGWRTVIVVTFRPHISRARFTLERCFGGSLVMVANPEHLSVLEWAHQYAYQTAGYVREALKPGC
jgi:uncharacterized SAM-binding protein YcdF (DUF218 family)